MKRIIIILTALFFLTAPVFAANHPALVVSDYYGYRLEATDGVYMYGLAQSALQQIVRVDANGTATNGADFSAYTCPDGDGSPTVRKIFSTDTIGMVFVLAEDTAIGKFYLYKSVDSGASFGDNSPAYDDGDEVLILGDTDGSVANQIAAVSVLRRGLIDTGTTIFAGEYNINGSRTNGGANDQVRLMKSTDNGDTWTEVIHWNTDGSNNNIRHIHAVLEHPTTGDIYIATGDSNAQSMILRWDGSTNISAHSNHNPSWYDKDAGNVAYATDGVDCGNANGGQRFRTVDMLFSGSYLFTFTDNTTDAGIYRHSLDLTVSQLMDDRIANYADQVGWNGFIDNSGNMYFSSYCEDAATDEQLVIFASGNSGLNWEVVGRFGKQAGAGGLEDIFEFNGKLYLSISNGSGKSQYDTSVVEVSGSFAHSDTPLILHPVFFVESTGTNAVGSNRGWRPSLPWQTVEYAMEGDRICKGARVKVGTGTFNGAIWADWDSPTYDGTGTVVIDGNGIDSTAIDYNAANYTLYIESAEGKVRLEDLTLKNTGGANIALNIQDGDVEVENVRIGDKITSATYPNVSLGAEGASFQARRTFFDHPLSGTEEHINLTAANCTVDVAFCVFYGSNGAIRINGAGSDVTMRDSIIYLPTTYGVTTTASATVTPIVKNCILVGTGTEYALTDDASLSELDEQIDFNCYYGLLFNNILNSGGSNSINSNPLFTDESGFDFSLLAASPLINLGTNNIVESSLDTDMANNFPIQGGRRDIGAYEYVESISGGVSIR